METPEHEDQTQGGEEVEHEQEEVGTEEAEESAGSDEAPTGP